MTEANPPIPVVGRYAPSPTGFLHLGNLRTALIAWLAARLSGGKFLMRVEDTDVPRVKEGCEEQQLRELESLGLSWDGEVVRQSERDDIYRSLLNNLEAEGHLFWCTCSRKEIEESVSAPHDEPTGPEGPNYPGTCRNSTKSEQVAHPNGAACRLTVPDDSGAIISFSDECLGKQTGDLRALGGDIVIQRRDGLWAYQFACAVDDALQGITQVVRGADLASSTFKQLYIQQVARLTNGIAAPTEWWHVPLLNSPDGDRLSKRFESLSMKALTNSGWRPEDITGWLAASAGIHPGWEGDATLAAWPKNHVRPVIPAVSSSELLQTLTREKLLRACRAW